MTRITATRRQSPMRLRKLGRLRKAEVLQAYDVYSKTRLKIQADKAQKDLSVIATKVSQEGQEYLVIAARNFPDSDQGYHNNVQGSERLYGPSEYEDYHVGVLFGTFLTVWGFINFMLTGTTSALHFGIILGLALLDLGISSLRSQREGGRRPHLERVAEFLGFHALVVESIKKTLVQESHWQSVRVKGLCVDM